MVYHLSTGDTHGPRFDIAVPAETEAEHVRKAKEAAEVTHWMGHEGWAAWSNLQPGVYVQHYMLCVYIYTVYIYIYTHIGYIYIYTHMYILYV